MSNLSMRHVGRQLFWTSQARMDCPISGLDCSMIRDFFAKLVRRTKSQHRCVEDRVVLNRTTATIPTMCEDKDDSKW